MRMDNGSLDWLVSRDSYSIHYPGVKQAFTSQVWSHSHYTFINPRRACAARITVVGLCVCLSVCLSVDDYSRTTGYEAAYERYQQLPCYKGMKNNVAILLKRLRSRDMANMHNQHWLTSTRFSPFSPPWTKGLCIQVQRCSKPTHDHAASL